MTAAARALRALFASLVIVTLLLTFALWSIRPRSDGDAMSLVELQSAVSGGLVKQAHFLANDDRLQLTLADGRDAWVAFPPGTSVSGTWIVKLTDAGVDLRVEQQSGKQTMELLAQFILPLLLLANLFGIFILLTRGGTGQIRDLFAFSRMGAKKSEALEANPYRFSNVAASDRVVAELAEIAEYLRNPSRYAALGALPPKGVLLSGPPGCGKTLLARALAGEVGVPFYFISGSEFVESLVGVGAARVRDLFRQALATAPSLIFIDELDAAGRRRGTGVGGGHDEREQTLNELLVQMDGFAPSAGVVLIGATNRPDILDPALLRPGRFDRHIVVEAPDADGRAEILELHARSRRLAADVDLDAIADDTPGCTGADLANIVNEAALLAVRNGRTSIFQTDLREAVNRVVSGPQRQGRLLSNAEVERLALHEAGHVVVAANLLVERPIQRASIVARGENLAHTDLLVRTDRVVATRSELLADLAVVLAGIAAEVMETGEASTAGHADVDRATSLARDLAGRQGMSDAVGRVRVLESETAVFLGRELAATNRPSSETLEAVDAAVRELIADAEARATSLLREHRATLRRVAAALVAEETLEKDELAALLAGGDNGVRKRGKRQTSGAPTS